MTAVVEIREGGLDDERVVALLTAHLDLMRSQSPPESVHALDLDGLRGPDITFLTAWDGETLLGCGALKRHDAMLGEVKSMHTAAAARRRGVGRLLLDRIEAMARDRGLTRLSLETGSPDGFAAGRALYASQGFAPCEPFADYRPDPFSVFMTKRIA